MVTMAKRMESTSRYFSCLMSAAVPGVFFLRRYCGANCGSTPPPAPALTAML
jgi:hypothetical protein